VRRERGRWGNTAPEPPNGEGLSYVPIYLEEECSIQKGEKSWQVRGEEGRRQVGQTQHQSPQVTRPIPATENKIQ
jgi:hypothetical protein